MAVRRPRLVGRANEPATAMIDVESIDRNPNNPRVMIDDEEFRDLVRSVSEYGLLQPILVRPRAGERYELVAGERRWAAARECGIEAIPCLIRDLTDEQSLKYCLVENLLKKDLDEAELYAGLEGLRQKYPKLTDLAQQIGRRVDWLSNRLGPYRNDFLRDRLISGKISAVVAEEIDRAPDEIQEPLARIADGKIGKAQIRGLRQLYVGAPPEKQALIADRIERVGFVPFTDGKRLSAVKAIIREGVPDFGLSKTAFDFGALGETAESPMLRNGPRSLPGTIAVLRGLVVQILHAEDATAEERSEVEGLAEKLRAWANS